MSLADLDIKTSSPPPAPPRKWTTGRIIGNALMALWIVLGIWIVWYLISTYSQAFYDKYTWKFLRGLSMTLTLVSLSIVVGFVLSIPIAFARMSKLRIIRVFAFSYVYFFRGTPLIAQTFLLYYGAGSFRGLFEGWGLWWFFRDAFNCAILIFSMNTAAYQAEILRGAIQNMPKGQWEAGEALGIKRHIIFFKVILPQAMIVALRPYGNEIVLMIKGSAIASIITVYDLMGETRRAFSRSFDYTTYIWAAIMYLILVETLRRVWDKLEMRLTRHLKR
ncbi:MAG: amino acid ABC transporter permease [Hyphomicrobiales bacterium]|nr:MAG: amino acid ABC transporter permease [Hyphomicrobiales bacterium]